MLHKKVLLIDLDQQGHLSRWIGWQDDGKSAISELIYQEVSKIRTTEYSQFVRHSELEALDYISATKMFGGIFAILGTDGESKYRPLPYFSSGFFPGERKSTAAIANASLHPYVNEGRLPVMASVILTDLKYPHNQKRLADYLKSHDKQKVSLKQAENLLILESSMIFIWTFCPTSSTAKFQQCKKLRSSCLMLALPRRKCDYVGGCQPLAKYQKLFPAVYDN